MSDNYTQNFLVLDFETFYAKDFSLSKMSVPEYVHDLRFSVIGLAVSTPEPDETYFVQGPLVADELAVLQKRYGDDFEKVSVVFHNGYFDGYILNHVYGIRPKYIIDTMLLSYHVNGRLNSENGRRDGESASLDSLSKKYGLGSKGSIHSFENVKELSENQMLEMAQYAMNDAMLERRLARVLLDEMTNLKVELPLAAQTIKLFTQGGLHVDIPALEKLQAEIKDDMAIFLKAAGVSLEEVGKNKRFTELLSVALARTGRKVPIKYGKKGEIPATAKTDEAMIALCTDEDIVVNSLVNARLKRKSQDQLIARLEKIKAIAKRPAGTVPVMLFYHGARTGRWSGAGGLNFHNMGRRGFGGRIRNLLVPAQGNVFVVGDLAAIEARGVAWMAGEIKLLRSFEAGADIYSEFAAGAFQQEVRKPRPGDTEEYAKELSAFRQVGKEAILGLGYNMGSLKFFNRLRVIQDTAPLFSTGLLSSKVCRGLVKEYRGTFSKIPDLWAGLEAAFRHVIQTKEKISYLRFTLEWKDGTLLLWLPSGRALRYPNPQIVFEAKTIKYIDIEGDQDEFVAEGYGIKYGNGIDTYGGKLTENVVQAASRDILAGALLRLEAQGKNIVLHCHDEIVLECRREDAEKDKIALHSALVHVPDWANGWPLAAEVAIMERYGK